MPEYAKKTSTTTSSSETKPQTTTSKGNSETESKKVLDKLTEEPEGPVSKALDAFARAEPGLVEAAASAYIMRTDKGEKQLVGDETKGIKASGTHESALQATAYGRAEAVKLGEQYAVLVEAGLIVGGSLKLSGELEAKYGKLSAKLGANLTLFGGAVAKVSGRAQIGSNGVVLQGKAEAFAGAKGKGTVEGSFDVGALGLGGEIEAEGKAGAWGEAEGELSFSKESIAMQGNVSAFAGVEGTVTGTAKGRLYGRDAFTVKASATGQLGVGGEVGGGVKFRGGKIEVNLDAKGTLGLGGGGEIDLTADLKPVAVWCFRQIDKAKWALRTDGKGKSLLDDPTQIVEPLATKIAKYSQEKIDGLELKKAENFVKIEKLQQYVGEVCPRKQIKGRPNAAAIDTCIKTGLEKGLRTTTEVNTITVTVVDGKIEKIDNLPEAEELAARKKVKSKTGKALDSIVSTD